MGKTNLVKYGTDRIHLGLAIARWWQCEELILGEN